MGFIPKILMKFVLFILLVSGTAKAVLKEINTTTVAVVAVRRDKPSFSTSGNFTT